jgi:hypothetical protein
LLNLSGPPAKATLTVPEKSARTAIGRIGAAATDVFLTEVAMVGALPDVLRPAVAVALKYAPEHLFLSRTASDRVSTRWSRTMVSEMKILRTANW